MTPPLKADQQAAERVLKKAVRRAVEMLRPLADPFAKRKVERHETGVSYSLRTWTDYERDMVRMRAEQVLAAAATAAELLLEERDA